MAGFFQSIVQGAVGTAKDNVKGSINRFFGNDYLRDYSHAAKTFIPNSYQYAPKLKFLFHVYFDISREANVFDNNDHLSLTVKSIKLPTYSIDTHVLNQYNRKRIVQTKMKYDPIQVVMHDDGGNLTRDLWRTYSQYYYGDLRDKKTSDSGYNRDYSVYPVDLNQRTQYSNDGDFNKVEWGYQAENVINYGSRTPTGEKRPFFNSVIVYGFNQHDFTMYKLINPIITQFSHDQYSYSEGSGVMENSMTIDYETVIYNSGKLDGRNPGKLVKDFADQTNYDTRPSPLGRPGTNASILGQGGLLDAGGGIWDNLTSVPPNILGAIQTAGVTYNTFKNGNLKKSIQNDVNNVVNAAIKTNVNSAVQYFTPTATATPVTANQWKTSINPYTNGEKLNFVPKIISTVNGTGNGPANGG